MPYDYGKLYGIDSPDPNDYMAYLSWVSSDLSTSITTKSLPYGRNTAVEQAPVMFICDSTNEKEFCILDDINSGTYGRFSKYEVALGNGTGTSSIFLDSSTPFQSAATAQHTDYFGIKKDSDSLYYVYYGTRYAISTLGYTYDFHRISIVPGVSYTDNVLSSVDISSGATYTWVVSRRDILGKNAYVALVKKFSSDWHYELHIYQLNMETDAVTQNVSWDSGSGIILQGAQTDNMYVAFGHSGNTMNWATGYIEMVESPPPTGNYEIIGHVVYNGTDTTVFSLFTTDTLSWWRRPQSVDENYNWVDSILAFYFRGGGLQSAIINNGTLTYYADATGLTPGNPRMKFFSTNTFLKMSADYTTMEYWWMNANGRADAVFLPTGVHSIYNVYPTVDYISGNIFVSALMDDMTTKYLLEVDPNTDGIVKQITVSGFSYPLLGDAYPAFNIGNFLIIHNNIVAANSASSLSVYYLSEITPPSFNESQMIVEMN
jgi:hypothetical protein